MLSSGGSRPLTRLRTGGIRGVRTLYAHLTGENKQWITLKAVAPPTITFV